MSIATQIIARLNSADAIANGLSNADAHESAPNVVSFTFPAPVVSGACVGTLTIASDGSIFDDTMDNVHADFDAFVADLNSMMEI